MKEIFFYFIFFIVLFIFINYLDSLIDNKKLKPITKSILKNFTKGIHIVLNIIVFYYFLFPLSVEQAYYFLFFSISITTIMLIIIVKLLFSKKIKNNDP